MQHDQSQNFQEYERELDLLEFTGAVSVRNWSLRTICKDPTSPKRSRPSRLAGRTLRTLTRSVVPTFPASRFRARWIVELLKDLQSRNDADSLAFC